MTKTITVTGAAGQIGYSLLFPLAAGYVYREEPVRLRLLDIPEAMSRLEAAVMELSDCALPTLEDVQITDDPEVAFEGADAALLVGSMPRKKGMNRADLLGANGEIFAAQGRALAAHANPGVKVVVTGNPANTNALITAHHAHGLDPRQITGLTRLDHNRAISQLAEHLGVPGREVRRMAVWGNHSATQFPDLRHAVLGDGREAAELVDPQWVQEQFIPRVADRGMEIIAARGASSAASAAFATMDHLRDWEHGTGGEWVSMAVPSRGEYGVPEGLMCSFPVTVSEGGQYAVVEGLKFDDAARARLDASVEELVGERDQAAQLGFLG